MDVKHNFSHMSKTTKYNKPPLLHIFMLRQEASIPSHGGLSVCLSSKYFDFLNKDDWAGIRFEKSTKRSIW